MGIGTTGLNILLELRRDTPIHGSCLQIGRQTIYMSPDQFLRCAERWQLESAALNLLKKSPSLDDQHIFGLMGLDPVESLDYSNYESPTHVADLNLPVPPELHGKYDFIYDGGSSEHIFDFPQVLENYHAMLKPGGILAHAIPSTNHLDHGFYMFSPTLLWDYYLTNNYRILRAYVLEYTLKSALAGKPARAWGYDPSRISNTFAGWQGNNILLWFVVEKLERSTARCIPQQGVYRGVKGWDTQPAQNVDIHHLLPKSDPMSESPRQKMLTELNSLTQKSIYKLGLSKLLSNHSKRDHTMSLVGYF